MQTTKEWISPLALLTQEQREEMRVKANETREAKKLAGQHLKQDFSDELHWRMLASKYGARLPAKHIAGDETKYLRRLFKKVDMDIGAWLNECCGLTKLIQLHELNPDWPMYAHVGTALEWVDEQKCS